MKARSEGAQIGIVIYEGVEPIDIGGTAGVVSMARRVLPEISCVMIAERTGPVRLAGGVTVLWGDTGRPGIKARELAVLMRSHVRYYDVSALESVAAR